MNKKLLLILFFIIFGLTSCSTVQVSEDFDSTYNFAGATTYNWNKELQATTVDLLKNDELLKNRFVKAIDSTLTTQGYALSDSPDFLVSCTYNITSRLRSEPIQPTIGVGYGRYGRFGGFGVHSGSTVSQYDRGELTINIHETKGGNLLWKGIGTQEVFTHNNPEQISQYVNEMVNAILSQFPPSQQ
ncbi:DUF4136 domain-containing protein [Desulforhopalus sp. IMCC35007]|uniref:DUF4136 domain-containing protein n=1 Tax=Desulforhopalus sp. IMCC35007 TaxID=2569543 RepID=UPI0010AE8E79|nr:DUF4136 domain-containing protein [Desulforhopalus sp. IMCC35007]TKB10338.1 DUF4136 domain-containing protein [Desulforhopalus sp. IMCC35007]